MSEGFFSRWSRRKQEVAAGQPAPEPARAAVAPAPVARPATPPVPTVQTAPQGARAEAASSAPVEAPLPTLEQVQGLTPASDFQPFMQRGVDAQVRNAAMKKLFADPHFNVMDGLDIYIDDYGQPDPLPAGMLRRMASAQFMKLVPDEAPPAPASPVQDPQAVSAPPVVAQSPLPAPKASAPENDHPDLQLQPDPAPADPEPGSRSG